MAGYSARQSTITDGNPILAALFNNEYNTILAAFHASTGHSHNGNAGEGAQIDPTDLRGGTANGLFVSNGAGVNVSSLAALTDGQLLVGATGANPTLKTLSGDATLLATGAITIANGVVTLAKMANMATASILGRSTAGTGVPEVLNATTVRSLLGVEAGSTADQTGSEIKSAYEAEANAFTDTQFTKLAGIEASANVTDTANVTSAGALMDSEVDADLKTFSLPANTTISTFGASLIDDAAASNARTTLGLGSLATLSNVPDNEITLAMMAHGTTGNLFTYDVAGAPAFVATGTAAQVLTSNGAGAAPTMQDAATSGAVLHDITSTSDVTMVVMASNTAAARKAVGSVIATKASVALTTTDRLHISINDLVLDGTAITINTLVDFWVRINSVHSSDGYDGGSGPLNSINGTDTLNVITAGSTYTYSHSHDTDHFMLLASDFISTDSDYTVDIMAASRNADDTPVVAGATATTVFKLRVDA